MKLNENNAMTFMRICCAAVAALCLLASSVYAETDEFDADKMLSELETQLELSGDKLSQLKPAIDAKSAELNKSINESVDRGFVELDKLSDQLDAASKDAQKKLQEALSSEEMQQLRDYLKKWDRDAIDKIKEDLAAQLTALLELTEDQISKLKPILEDGFNQLGEMLDRLAREGNKSLEKFKQQYEQLSEDLNQKLKDTLNSDQMKSLETYREELREKIKMALYSA
jgi:biopolymer transport protein ExbB/TolQ